MKVLSVKPNSISMSTFCAMLIEYGFDAWDKKMCDQKESVQEQEEQLTA